jgi:hypothetical protein
MKTSKYIILITFLLLAFTKSDNKSQYNIPISAWSVTVNDIDLDGDNDIVVGHKTAWQDSNPTITLLKNTNNGIFEIFDTTNVYCGYQENILTADINSDNYPDIISFRSDFTSGIVNRYIRCLTHKTNQHVVSFR